MPLAEDIQNAKKQIAAVTSEKEALARKVESLQSEVEKLNPSELDDQDRLLLKEVIMAEHGLTHSEIADKFQQPPAVIIFRLKKLDKLNYIAAHGGGLMPVRYKADDLGVSYALKNSLL